MIVAQEALKKSILPGLHDPGISINISYAGSIGMSLVQMEQELLHGLERESYVQKARQQRLPYLLGRLSAKELLQARIGGPLKNIPIIATKRGPFCPLAPDFFINISHSGDFGAACLSSMPTGIDIETMRPRSSALTSFTLHGEESDLLRSWDDSYRAVIGWSMKEACHKALRTEESFCPRSYTISRKHDLFFVERDSVCWHVAVAATGGIFLSLAQPYDR